MIKKITDERLQLKNLKNIRVLFIIQNIGMISILGYDLVTRGMDGMTSNPLWFLLLLTGVISGYLSLSISIDHESEERSPKKGFITSLIVAALISIVVGFFVSWTDGFGPINGIVIASIIFICSLAPILYIHYLR